MARCRLNWQNPMFLSRNLPRFDDQPAAKTKIPILLQLFFDWGLFFVPVKRKRVVTRLITCAFTPIFEIEGNATVRNRKKVAS